MSTSRISITYGGPCEKGPARDSLHVKVADVHEIWQSLRSRNIHFSEYDPESMTVSEFPIYSVSVILDELFNKKNLNPNVDPTMHAQGFIDASEYLSRQLSKIYAKNNPHKKNHPLKHLLYQNSSTFSIDLPCNIRDVRNAIQDWTVGASEAVATYQYWLYAHGAHSDYSPNDCGNVLQYMIGYASTA